jgi:hypothetical protein
MKNITRRIIRTVEETVDIDFPSTRKRYGFKFPYFSYENAIENFIIKLYDDIIRVIHCSVYMILIG